MPVGNPPFIHELLACTSLDDKNLGDIKMFEEEINFVTAADDDAEFTNEDGIFFFFFLCVPFTSKKCIKTGQARARCSLSQVSFSESDLIIQKGSFIIQKTSFII